MSWTRDHKSGSVDILPTNLQEKREGLTEVSAGAGCRRCVCKGVTTEEDEWDHYFNTVSLEELV